MGYLALSINYVVSGAGEGGSPKHNLLHRPNLINKTTRGRGGQKLLILRRQSFWTAPLGYFQLNFPRTFCHFVFLVHDFPLTNYILFLKKKHFLGLGYEFCLQKIRNLAINIYHASIVRGSIHQTVMNQNTISKF